MLERVTVARDLTVVVGDEAVRLTPAEGFELAQRLIRRSTSRLVDEEISARQQPGSEQGASRQ